MEEARTEPNKVASGMLVLQSTVPCRQVLYLVRVFNSDKCFFNFFPCEVLVQIMER